MTIDPLTRACAATIHEHYHSYQDRFQRITQRAPDRFVHRQWAQIRSDATERLNLYATIVDRTESDIRAILQGHTTAIDLWAAAKASYAKRITDGDDRGLAETFFNSVTRRIFGTVGINRQIEFVHTDPPLPRPETPSFLFDTYPLKAPVAAVIRQVLASYGNLPMNAASLEQVLPRIESRIEKRLHDLPACFQISKKVNRPCSRWYQRFENGPKQRPQGGHGQHVFLPRIMRVKY